MNRVLSMRTLMLAGAVSGFLILGVGGRLLMRGLAYTTAEGPRFSISGTLEVLALGLGWGALTGPLLALFRRGHCRPRMAGVLHGIAVLGIAILLFLIAVEGGGRVVAPLIFIILGAILFPVLFVIHGVVVEHLATSWSRKEP